MIAAMVTACSADAGALLRGIQNHKNNVLGSNTKIVHKFQDAFDSSVSRIES